MAQEIMVAGAIYEDVPSVRLPDSHGTFHPFTDTSDTTAVAADVAEGKLFHLADGALATGTASGGGGGGESADPKDVNFIDYDGTIVYSYTAAEFLALTAMPANPTHTGLVSQGWNWTLADAQEYVADYGIQTIGQMYVTESGDTEIDIVLHDGRLSPYLSLAPNGTVTIDFGDGSATDTVTGTSNTTPINTRHDYAAAGAYTIKVHVESGTMALVADNTQPFLNKGIANAGENRIYAFQITGLRIGRNANIGDNAMRFCGSSYITIPNGITSIGSNAFTSTHVKSITIPSSVTSIGNTAFSNATVIKLLAMPNSVTSMGSSTFSSANSIKSVAVPSGVTSINNSTFSGCYVATSVSIPNGVVSIEDNAFQNMQGLASVTIPKSVTSIGQKAFSYNQGLGAIHFKPTTPPTIANSNAFNALPTDCVIYVPQGSLSAYTSAAKYPSASTYTYVEE